MNFISRMPSLGPLGHLWPLPFSSALAHSLNPQDHKINKIVAWVRLPKLAVRYYHKSVIRCIGKALGKVIKVDYNTDSGERGKFARLAPDSLKGIRLSPSLTIRGLEARHNEDTPLSLKRTKDLARLKQTDISKEDIEKLTEGVALALTLLFNLIFYVYNNMELLRSLS